MCNPAKHLHDRHAADGSSCDDGNACGGRPAPPARAGQPDCGDGVVQAGCGEACDDGAGNGVDGCCSATCALVDGDGDGLCDTVDPCTGGVALTDTLLKIGRQTTPPGDDTIAWKGRLTLPPPFDPPLDPSTRGVRIVLAHGTSTALDVAIPGGSLGGSPAVGWRNLAGVRWLYVDKRLAPLGGITKVQVKQRPSIPGLLEFRVKGKRASLPPVPGNPPLAAILILDPPTATTGQCGEKLLTCTSNGSASSRRCQ